MLTNQRNQLIFLQTAFCSTTRSAASIKALTTKTGWIFWTMLLLCHCCSCLPAFSTTIIHFLLYGMKSNSRLLKLLQEQHHLSLFSCPSNIPVLQAVTPPHSQTNQPTNWFPRDINTQHQTVCRVSSFLEVVLSGLFYSLFCVECYLWTAKVEEN